MAVQELGLKVRQETDEKRWGWARQVVLSTYEGLKMEKETLKKQKKKQLKEKSLCF